MKQSRILLLLFFVINYSLGVCETNDTINYYMFYPGSKYKIPERREIIKYDKQDLTLVICYENWDKQTKQWRFVSKNKLTYNKQLRLEKKEDYHINYLNNEERLRKVYYYEYDSAGNNTQILVQVPEYNSTFINQSKTERVYKNGLISEIRDYDWHRELGNKHWKIHNEQHYSYDSIGRIKSKIMITTNRRENGKKIEMFSYDDNARLREKVKATWDDSLNEWLPLYNEKIFLNDLGNDSLMLMKKRNSSNNEWPLIIKDSFNYNQKGNLLEMLRFVYNKENASWVFSSKLKITYDNKGKVITKEYFDEWKKKLNNYAVRNLVEYIIHGEAVEFTDFYTFPSSD